MKSTQNDHTTLYRKYRPQTFADVLGQDHVVSVLQSAIEKKSIAHAYLFAGSRGTGKTSIARILSRELGVAPNDLYEIDGASHRGIDEARSIREAVHTLPFESPYKVYLIDEAHMLTPPAWNALLKTLEEPPAHVIFMFATTELEKVPDTILSRCQIFQFKKPTHAVLKEMLMRVAKKEGYTLPEDAAALIAILSRGAFRDSLGLLQQVLGATDSKTVTAATVEQVTGAPKTRLVTLFIGALAKKDVSAALGVVRDVSVSGVDLEVFVDLILSAMRAVLLLRYAGDMQEAVLAEYGEEERAFLKEMSGASGQALNSKVLVHLLEASERISLLSVPALALELAVVKIAEER